MSRNILPLVGQPRTAFWEPVCGWASLAPGAASLVVMLGVLLQRFPPGGHLNGLIVAAVALAVFSNGNWMGLAGFGMAATAFSIELFVLLMTAAVTGR